MARITMSVRVATVCLLLLLAAAAVASAAHVKSRDLLGEDAGIHERARGILEKYVRMHQRVSAYYLLDPT